MIIEPPDIDIGWTAHVTAPVTDKTVLQFAEMSGDFNPIHMDEAFAATTKFKRRIAHGMISGAFISRALNEKIGSGGIYLAQTLKFVNPVYIGDTITIELAVTNIRKDRGIAIVSTNVKNQNGEYCVKGDATIMLAAPK